MFGLYVLKNAVYDRTTPGICNEALNGNTHINHGNREIACQSSISPNNKVLTAQHNLSQTSSMYVYVCVCLDMCM